MRYKVIRQETGLEIRETESRDDAEFIANFEAGTTDDGVYEVLDGETVAYTAGEKGVGKESRFYLYCMKDYSPEEFEEKKERLYS
jgi:hypothetical protein